MIELNRNKQLFVNMLASLIAYIVSYGISLVLSPYIVGTVGVSAYGFVGLANNFIGYASLITVALNALAGRFITIKIYEKDFEGANKYYSSVFIANVFLSVLLLIVATFVWIFLDLLIKIPDEIFWDVKILFASLFLNCIISTVGSVFSTATFATNKLYLNSIRNIESNVIRLVILVLLYIGFAPKICYLGITSLFTGVYCLFYNIRYTNKLLPWVKIERRYFDFRAIIELLSSGVWSLVNRLGQILLEGVDLLITNVFIDATAMGVLSLAKTIPGLISNILATVAGVFSPNFTILYAQKKMDELLANIKQSMKIMGVITNLPIIILIVCGKDFFELWQPSIDSTTLQNLSFLTIACIVFSGGINCLYGIFNVVNKLKANSLVVVFSGGVSAVITFVLLKTTHLGIYAVAGTSTVISIIRNLVFTAPYGARCLNLKWYTFYPDIFKPVIYVIISIFLGAFSTIWLDASSWFLLIIKGIIVGGVSLTVGCFVILNMQERSYLKNIILRRQ